MFCLLVITLTFVLAQNVMAQGMMAMGSTALELKTELGIDLDVAQELVASFDLNADGMLSIGEMTPKFMAIMAKLKAAQEKGIKIDIAGLEILIDLDLGNILNLDLSGGVGGLLGGNRGVGSLTSALGLGILG